MSSKLFCVFAAGIAMAWSWGSPVIADSINYGDFLGAGVGEADFLQVTENSITNPLPLFGTPVHVGNKLMFFPMLFAASAADGNYDAVSGTLTAHIRAAAGHYLQTIAISEIGDCTLLGVGYANTWADVYGLLSACDASPGTHGNFASFLSVSPAPPYMLPPTAFTTFEGEAQISLAGLGITEIAFAFTDTLEASSEPGTTAYIQKKEFQIEVTSAPVPEPSAGVLALLSVIALLTRRRCA